MEGGKEKGGGPDISFVLRGIFECLDSCPSLRRCSTEKKRAYRVLLLSLDSRPEARGCLGEQRERPYSDTERNSLLGNLVGRDEGLLSLPTQST